MDEIELVVKIPKEVKNRLCFGVTYSKDIQVVCEALNDGTPLPKGHGKIGDLTKLYNEIDTRNKGKNKGKYTGILALVGFADTIIEADKGDGGNDG